MSRATYSMETNKAADAVLVELGEHSFIIGSFSAHCSVSGIDKELNRSDLVCVIVDSTCAYWARACANHLNIDTVEAVFTRGTDIAHLDLVLAVGSVHRKIDQV